MFSQPCLGIEDPSDDNQPVRVVYSAGDLLPDTLYHFRIKAINGNEDGETESDWVETSGRTAGNSPLVLSSTKQ